MNRNTGADIKKILAWLAGAGFVIWFLTKGMKLVNNFMDFSWPTPNG